RHRRCSSDRHNISCPCAGDTCWQASHCCACCTCCCIGDVSDSCVDTNCLCISTSCRSKCYCICSCNIYCTCCCNSATTTSQGHCVSKCSRHSRCAGDRYNITCPCAADTCRQASHGCTCCTCC